jgi:hypothetical protein
LTLFSLIWTISLSALNASFARLIKPVKESDGKWAGHSNKKIGNHHAITIADWDFE